MIATTIDIQGIAETDAALAAKMRQCDPHVVATRITPPLSTYFRNHLRSLPKNRNGYPSTFFWESAARSVTGVAVGGDAVISASKLGLRQRLYGGTIAARNVKNITIPICAEAYGTTVADWGYENLVLVILSDGRKFLALWLGSEAAQTQYQQHLGKKLTRRAETTAARVARLRAGLSRAPGEAKKPDVIVFKEGSGSSQAQQARAERYANLKFLFVLKQSVEQAANPLVIPPSIQEFAVAQVKLATR